MTSVPRTSTSSQERTRTRAIRDACHVGTGLRASGCRAPTLRRVWPDVVAHADWSVDRRKRWVCVARRRDDRYTVETIEPVADLAALVGLTAAAESAVIGVDAPIGLPVAYARAAGIDRFLPWLRELSAPALAAWSRAAATPRRHRSGPTLLPAAPGRGPSRPPGRGPRPVVVRRPPPTAATARRRWPGPRLRCSGRWAPTRSARPRWRCGPTSSACRRCGCGPSTAASRIWSPEAG